MSAPVIPSKRPFSLGRWFTQTGWRHLVGLVATVFAAFPLVYVLSASLNPSGTLTGSNRLFQVFSLENYRILLTTPSQPYGRWYLNTLLVATSSALGTVFLGALAAYAFSRMRFTGRRVGLLSLLLVQMFPQMLGMVAIFLLLTWLGDIVPVLGLGSGVALVMIYLGGAMGVNTYLMYGFFNTVPLSLDEAARVDGAGHARIFFTIILRLVAPILAVVGLLSFISSVNEFIIASVVLGGDPQGQTLAVGLYQFVSQLFNTNFPVFTAGAVLAAIPVMALFLYLQKYIVSGLTAGAVK
ncbi:MAG: sugar ABC transporter permease [Actinomycetia bacterium]|nr:sugar ABC transporter permease [Actinomycetes bacterium]